MNFRKLTALFFSVLLLVISNSVYAQDTQDIIEVKLTAKQIQEINKWMKTDKDWQKWNKSWGNRAYIKIKHRPDPPVWLPDKCEKFFEDEVLLTQACDLLGEIKDYTSSYIRRNMIAERNQKEAPIKTTFIERIHFGGGWPLVRDVHSFKYGGIFESHVSVANIGRLEINLPGVIILSLPDLNGVRGIRFGTHVGLGFRLMNFNMPGSKQTYVLHMNIAKAWANENIGGFGFQNQLSLAGLSVTLKNCRK